MVNMSSTQTDLSKSEHQLIIDALWWYGIRIGEQQPLLHDRVNTLRKKLLKTSLEWGTLTAWSAAQADLPPEST